METPKEGESVSCLPKLKSRFSRRKKADFPVVEVPSEPAPGHLLVHRPPSMERPPSCVYASAPKQRPTTKKEKKTRATAPPSRVNTPKAARLTVSPARGRRYSLSSSSIEIIPRLSSDENSDSDTIHYPGDWQRTGQRMETPECVERATGRATGRHSRDTRYSVQGVQPDTLPFFQVFYGSASMDSASMDSASMDSAFESQPAPRSPRKTRFTDGTYRADGTTWASSRAATPKKKTRIDRADSTPFRKGVTTSGPRSTP